MKKTLLIVYLLNLIVTLAYGQVYKGQVDFSKIPVPGFHYLEEYDYDTTINIAAWKNQEKGLHVSFASTDDLYFRTEVPELESGTVSWSGIGWKGERLNAEILVWSPDTINQIHFVVHDLKNKQGKVLNKNNI